MDPKAFQKSFQMKNASVGADVTPEMLAKINRYALKVLTEDEVYARKFLLAHNAVDRDGERFSEAILDDFANTLPGKSFLFAHDRRNYLPFGLYFDASTENISVDQFKELTGETPHLPEGTESVKVMWAWYYIIKESGHDDTIKNIEGGTYRHASIGFSAMDLVEVKSEFDQRLYWEYVSPGEATEGSLVWLGAQPGATSQKAYKEQKLNEKGGNEDMKKTIILLGQALGKSFSDDTTEEAMVEAVKAALNEKDTKVVVLEGQVSELEQKLETGKLLMEEGKAYRNDLVDDFARMKASLGECEETDEAAKSVKAFAGSMPIDFLKTEVKNLQARMEEKFPSEGKLNGDARRDKSEDGEDNPLIPK